MRRDLWIGKSQFPALFKQVSEATFTPALLINAFKKCGIAPFDPKAVSDELVTKPDIELAESKTSLDESINSIDETVSVGVLSVNTDAANSTLADVEISIETVGQTDVPEGAVVLLTGNEEKCQSCPPELAIQAIESALTPTKFRSYMQKFSKDADNPVDPVYTTWKYLKITKEGRTVAPVLPSTAKPEPVSNILVKTGIIPRSLVDIVPIAHEAKPRPVRLGRKATVKARVLTSEEIVSARA